MTTTDKPTVHASLADLDREVGEKVEPFRFQTPKGAIVFPNPGDMDWLEAEEFLAGLGEARNSEVFQRWLEPKDFDRLKSLKLSLNQVMALSGMVTKHYEAVFGAPGEGSGSTGS